MTQEQKAAYVNAQAAMLNAHIALMVAENMYRDRNGQQIAYCEDAFATAIREYSNLEHNNLIGLFHNHG